MIVIKRSSLKLVKCVLCRPTILGMITSIYLFIETVGPLGEDIQENPEGSC